MMSERTVAMMRRPGVAALLGALLLATFLGSCGDGTATVSTPSGGWLAVVRDGQLVLVDPATGEARSGETAATNGPAAWSDNGQLIAFVSGQELWSGRAEGPWALSATIEGASGDATLAWSPDALDLAIAFEGGAVPGVYVLDRLEQTVERLYPVASEIVGWWSPSGIDTPLLVVRELNSNDVYMLDPEAGTRRRILNAQAVSVRPGDDRIAYIDAGGDLRLWSVFEAERPLVTGVSGLAAVRWSPAGESIAFEAAGRQLWLTNAIGGSPSVLVTGGDFDWSRDGTQLAVAAGGVVSIVDAATVEAVVEVIGESPRWQSASRSGPLLGLPGSGAEVRNILRASTSFEIGLGGWLNTGVSIPESERTTDDSVVGDASALVTFTGGQSAFAATLTGMRAELGGKTLTFSAWVRTDGQGVRLVHAATNYELTDGVDQSAPHPGDGAWHRLEMSFTPMYDIAGQTAYVVLGLSQDSTAVAFLDAVQLEVGATATAFQPQLDDPISGLPRGEPISAR